MRRFVMILVSCLLMSTGIVFWAAGSSVIPEPKALMMLALGLGALRAVRLKRPT